MWTYMIKRLYGDGAEFAEPATAGQVDGIEQRLGQAVPDDLRALLLEADGVRYDGTRLVWSVREILAQNTELRGDEALAGLYMSFDQLVFVADNGGGDLFGYRTLAAAPPDLFAWDHETDERVWAARSLSDYLGRRAAATGDDWWRPARR